MKTDIDTGANASFKNLRVALKDTVATFEQVESAITNTLDTVSKFSTGLNSMLDCRVVRQSIRDLETGLCFSVRKTFYSLFLLMTLTTLMMALMNCCICCSLGKINSRVGNKERFAKNIEKKSYAKKDNKA